MKAPFLSNTRLKVWPTFLLLALLMLLMTACEMGAATTIFQPVPTNTPIPPSDTPMPTDTPTLEPTATFTSTPDFPATAAAEATVTADALTNVINAVLADYGLSTSSGHLGWFGEEPLTLITRTYGETKIESIAEGGTFADFILHVNVTWDSKTGFAGCGIILRSESNLEQGEQYQFLTLRLSGAPAWDVELHQFGRWLSTATGDVKFNSAISLAAGATNEYLLVLDGSTLTIYANGTRIGTVTLSKRSSGALGVLNFQDSGETTCTFGDMWVWVVND